MAEYTIDELAMAAGSNVRNVRAYQAKKLLPKPRRVGRANVYSDVHLARLKSISNLLDRGYSLGNIAEILNSFERGQGVIDIIGLESEISRPFNNELPNYITPDELAELFNNPPPEVLRQAAAMGLVRPDDGRLMVPSPRLLNVGAELHKVGIPLHIIISQLTQLRGDVERIANRFVKLIVDEVFSVYGDDKLPPQAEIPRLAEFIHRVRPMAQTVVDVELARSLDQAIQSAMGHRLARIAEANEKRNKSSRSSGKSGRSGKKRDTDKQRWPSPREVRASCLQK